jgi:thioredoxin 1
MATHEVTTESFNDTVKNNDIALFDFWATWCPPCRIFGPIFEAASDKYPDLYFGKIDADKNQQLAGAYGISSIPTLMITKGNKIVFQQAGALRAADLEGIIKRVQELDMSKIVEDRVEAETRANAPDISEP